MVKFLLVFFLFLPNGQVGSVKQPMKTEAECVSKAKAIVELAQKNNAIAVGTCVRPEDYLAAER